MLSGYLGGAVDRLMVLLMDTLYQLSVLLLSVVLAFLGKVILLIPPTPFVLCVCRSISAWCATNQPGEEPAACINRPECGGGAVLNLFLLARFLGFTHEDLLNLPKSLFQFLQPRHHGLTGGVLMDLARDLQLKHPVCSLDAATAMGGHHHRAMPATQQFIDLRFAAAVQR